MLLQFLAIIFRHTFLMVNSLYFLFPMRGLLNYMLKSLQVEEMEVEFAMQEGFLVDSFYLPSKERYRHTPMSVS